jgi:hypothetical protein
MKTIHSNENPRCVKVAAALLVLFIVDNAAPSRAHASPRAQAQAALQQTNGRGAIGVNCIPEANGCRIRRITKDGPGERGGLRVGDLLLRLNSSDPASVVEQITRNAPGTKITLPFQRGSEDMQAAITVEDQLALALRGAALGDANAGALVGSIYRHGAGVPENPAEALKWLRKAAEQGYNLAQYEIGSMYFNGEGMPKDDRTAVEWLRKAADQGLDAAQNQLGRMYSDGLGVTKDDRTAAEWFRKAAEQGYPTAQYNLGWCYENGRGVTKDLNAAIDWYTKAAAQDVEPAKQRLSTLHQ